MFVDLKGNNLLSSETGELPCFCQLVQSNPEGMRRCRQAFERAGCYSYSLGESYIYSCHAGWWNGRPDRERRDRSSGNDHHWTGVDVAFR